MYGATEELDDERLAPLGIHRLAVPVPFAEAGGPVNVYAIEENDGRWAFFDTGIGTEAGMSALMAQASSRGIDVRRVSRIFISHGHVDHFGNAKWLFEQSGAQVFVHPADLSKVIGASRVATLLRAHRDFFLSLGVPPETLASMLSHAEHTPDEVHYLTASQLAPLDDGLLLTFRHFQAEVKHFPGHTPGLVCLYAAREKILFADDHLLAKVSPNPLIDLSQGEGATKFRALARYLESARRAHQLELDCVLPGHGPLFRGHRALLDGLFEFYTRRQQKLLSRLEHGPASVYELLPTLFPFRKGGWLVLMLSEVLANVEVLEDRGQVVRLDGPVALYALKP